MKFRHEVKHGITYGDMITLRSRLSALMERDEHAVNGKYVITSLYFDTPTDKALREKLSGINYREKFRIRYYNDDLTVIHLEKKTKVNGLCLKESVPLTKAQVSAMLKGDVEGMLESPHKLIRELYLKMRGEGLKPKTVVRYTREPFVYGPGNVRVTLDYDIRTGAPEDFLNSDAHTLPAGMGVVLEVKWDEYLPDFIKSAVQLTGCRAGAFSKYAACRVCG